LLEDVAIGGDQERSGDFFNAKLASEVTFFINQQRELELPVVAGVENGIVRWRGAKREDRCINGGNSQSARTLLLGHAGQEYNLTARGSVGGVGDGLQEREEERLRWLESQMERAAADIRQRKVGQSGDRLGTAGGGQDQDCADRQRNECIAFHSLSGHF
jgi:hypothetical protein